MAGSRYAGSTVGTCPPGQGGACPGRGDGQATGIDWPKSVRGAQAKVVLVFQGRKSGRDAMVVERLR